MIRALCLSILVYASLVCASLAQASYPAVYDAKIVESTKRYWPEFNNPSYWKAQLFAESRLDPNAVSPVGAEGIAQFMPGTWSDVSVALGLGIDSSPYDPDLAIEAGAFYMGQLRAKWSAPRPEIERHRLAQASYNAGFGNIVRAQRLCRGASSWKEIQVCLPLVTGRHSKETIDYVAKIERWKGEFTVWVGLCYLIPEIGQSLPPLPLQPIRDG